MHPIDLRACAVALLAMAATAASAAPADPANPSASVPETRYESSFAYYQVAADEPASPDAVWKSANAAVAGTGLEGGAMRMPGGGSEQAPVATPGGHEGHAMGGHTGMAMPMPDKAPVMNMQHEHGKGH